MEKKVLPIPQESNVLISVSDKSGIIELANAFLAQGTRIYSTGGTAKTLREAGIPVSGISELTHFPEIMDGRVKTLHPRVFGGILARRENQADCAQAVENEIPFFDFVVVNLYPFAATIRKKDCTHEDAIENIDIGGVSLIRAAAKNYQDVAVITSPARYQSIIAELERNNGELSLEMRRKLAVQAFRETANYDAQIQAYFTSLENDNRKFPENLLFSYEKISELRYGENPHQQAALYKTIDLDHAALVNATQLQGKALSYNNIMDADTALNLAREFSRPAIAILKHANPCGVASADNLADAYRLALATDNVSAFGGIIGANREIDAETAKAISAIFTEVVIAPGFAADALKILAAKKNLRLLQTTAFQQPQHAEIEMKAVSGGILLQDKDSQPDDDTTFRVVTSRKPTEAEWQSMLFGWKVVKWVKSNAVIYACEEHTLGIGAGQMSRVDSSRIAAEKAKIAGLDLAGSIVASDAFFPFADGVETAAAAGATAVIQPGGSIRDPEVIAAANRNDMAMVFTGVRHFRH